MTRLSDVKPERVSWLWPGRLPLGKLVTLDGDPGKGKSTLALTFGAIVTTSGVWPDRTRCEYPGDVILMSAEDGLADTVRPRLDAAGGDRTRVHAEPYCLVPESRVVIAVVLSPRVDPLLQECAGPIQNCLSQRTGYSILALIRRNFH